ncbi:MAG: quinone oxidoreductase family protein [Flammeovirgaceae bacterium]
MKSLRLDVENLNLLVFKEQEVPELTEGMALVKVQAAALNRRDFWIREGKYPGIKPDITLGSDGCGIVEVVADEEHKEWINKEVIINPNINWGDVEEHQSQDYRILGMPDDGTFAEYIIVGIDRLSEKPKHLDVYQAAALPLAGLTAYRAVFTHAAVKKDDVVLVSGFGGGVAQFAFQFCVAVGAQVYVTTSSESKLKKAKELGAINGVNYKTENWHKTLKEMSGGFTHVVDSAGGDQVNTIIKTMRPAGRYVFYGASLGLPKNIDLYRVFYNQIRIQGTTMGSDKEFGAMIDFVNEHKIFPIVDSVIPFENALKAFEKMKKGEQMGKIVLSIARPVQGGNKLQESVSKIKDFFKGMWGNN